VDEPATTELVELAKRGDGEAWRRLVDRYRRVVWSATYGFRFDRATRDDICQLAWMRLVDHLDRIREPERLGGWLATTARRECIAVVRMRARTDVRDDVGDEVPAAVPELDSSLIRAETTRVVAEAFEELDAACRQLLRLLVAEPPLSYGEISAMLGMPVGSIGPTRARCLEKLGRRPSIRRISERIGSSHRSEDRDG
jgi:RNA polymerase sigma factor (sigma-70 family)